MTPQTAIWIQDGDDGRWLRFAAPVASVQADDVTDVVPALRLLEQRVESEGLWAAGFLSYEAAPAFDAALRVHSPAAGGLPLLWFGLFQPPARAPLPLPAAAFRLGAWQPALAYADFAAAIAAIHADIAAGATYQVNFTFPLQAAFDGDPYALFHAMLTAQQGVGSGPGIGRYAAYLDFGARVIACAAPELFFHRAGSHITARPMKGTAPRGPTSAADRALADVLRRSEKERAENVMIVDMIRNDLGRVARTGSVTVPALFDVARYPTLHQMTTTVTAESDVSQVELLRALFPCASITGAPKVRTMQIIGNLEAQPRGVYTGAIGYLAPGRRAQFNVAIRTALVDRAAGVARYGVGSGVVWDSQPAREYAECLVKAQIVGESQPPFQLITALRWEWGSGYWLLARHLARLADSAAYFGFAFDEQAVRAALDAHAAQMPAGVPRKVRLLLAADGALSVTDEPVGPTSAVCVWLAAEPVDSGTRWLYHKTTQRLVYERARRDTPAGGDVLLWNERGEVTETTTANVVFELDGQRVTPPVASGLLAGTLRAQLLADGVLVERVVSVEAARACRRWWLINAVRGWRPALWKQ